MERFEPGNGKERSVVYIPATKKAVYLDKQTFATIMCMIPPGKIATQEASARCGPDGKGPTSARSRAAVSSPLIKNCSGCPPMFSGWTLSQTSKSTASRMKAS